MSQQISWTLYLTKNTGTVLRTWLKPCTPILPNTYTHPSIRPPDLLAHRNVSPAFYWTAQPGWIQKTCRSTDEWQARPALRLNRLSGRAQPRGAALPQTKRTRGVLWSVRPVRGQAFTWTGQSRLRCEFICWSLRHVWQGRRWQSLDFSTELFCHLTLPCW